ncbi:MAG: hypothetical protein EXS00_02765 [Phycisphaerales bacterium]|nr:hypothetical protein [Phycisphaerales bacterium]
MTCQAAPLLAGPSIKEDEPPATLVVLDYEGRLQPLGDPEYDALRMLKLPASEQTEVDRIHLERRTLFHKISREHLGSIIELTGKFQSGKPGLLAALRGMFLISHYQPYFERGSLIDEVSPFIGDHAAAARTLVMQYDIAAARQMALELDTSVSSSEVGNRIRLRRYGELLRDLIEGQGKMAEDNFALFAEEYRLDDVQQGEMRRIFEPVYVQDVIGGGASIRERWAALREGWGVLTPSQQANFVARAIKQLRGES